MKNAKIKKIIDNEVIKKDEKALEFKEISLFKSFDVEGYKITPLKASHASSLNPCFYIIEKDDKFISYARRYKIDDISTSNYNDLLFIKSLIESLP